MKAALSLFWAALAYFSILPVRTKAALGPPSPATLALLPFVGALLGAASGSVGWLVSLHASHALAVASAFGASIVLTGALHIDGFLDSCDGLFASVSSERRLEILDDPRHGTFAVAGFAVLAAFWLAALWSLPSTHLPAALALSAALARWAVVCNALSAPYARAGALASTFAGKPSALMLVFEGAALLVAASYLLGYFGAGLLLALLLTASFFGARFARQRLGGGLTGDVYGFLIVLLEVGTLTACGQTRTLY